MLNNKLLLASVFCLCAFALALSAGKAYAGGSGGAAVDTGFQYVELDPLMLPIVDDHGVSQTINLVIALEVNSSASVDKAKRLKPKLTDAFLQDMYGILNERAAMKGGILQIGMIKERLNRVSDRVMGDDESVHDVLLQVIQHRPI